MDFIELCGILFFVAVAITYPPKRITGSTWRKPVVIVLTSLAVAALIMTF